MWTIDRNGGGRWIDLEREAAWAAYTDELEHLLEVKALRRELDEVRLALAHRRIAALELQVKALELKYRPDQPRVPAGRREGGQWTSDGAGTPSGHGGRGSPSGSANGQAPHRPPPGAATSRDKPAPYVVDRIDQRDVPPLSRRR